MNLQTFLRYLLIGIPFFSTLPSPASAQLVRDSSLGSESSVIHQINDSRQEIGGGATRGNTLFHSFQDFNVDTLKSVHFRNPVGIENILTRVTGSNPSKIFGTLGVLGNANLFLINPNGIIFGKDARLDLNGSFTGSTANSILLNNNFEFSATNPQNIPSNIIINFPIGFGFLQSPGQPPGIIRVENTENN